MAEQPRDFNHWVKSVERRLQQALRAGQSPQAVRLAREVQQVRDEVNNIEAGTSPVPSAPIELVIQTRTFLNAERRQSGEVSVSFPDVIRDVNSNDIEVDRYEMWLRNLTGWDENDEDDPRPLTLYATSISPYLQYAPVTPGQRYEVRVRAIAKGVAGPFSTRREALIERDTTPPPIPATLDLSSSGATVTASWNLLAETGEPMPGDFSHTEVTYGYQPGSEKVMGSLTTLFSQYIFETPPQPSDADFDGTWYFRHRAVDTSGNRSAWSPQAQIVPKKLVDDASIRFELDEKQREIDEAKDLMDTGLTEVNDKLIPLEQLSQDNQAALNTLNNTTLPALEGDLTALQGELDGIDLTGINNRLDEAEGDLNTLNNTILPELRGDLTVLQGELDGIDLTDINSRLGEAESDLDTLNSTTLPQLNNTITQGLADLDWREVGAISASNIRVGSYENLLPEDYIWELREKGVDGTPIWTDTTGGAAGWTTIINQLGMPVLIRFNASQHNGVTSRLAFMGPSGKGIRVRSGEQFSLTGTGWVSSGASDELLLQIRYATEDGSYVARISAGQFPNGDFSHTWEVPDDSTIQRMQIEFTAGQAASGNAHMGDIRLRTRIRSHLIVDGAVIADKIAANAVESDKIVANAITAAKIASNAVTAGKINANAVTADKINTNAVTANKIAANAVTTDKIAANAVTAGEILANAVTSDKIAANAVTAGKIRADAVTADKILANAVTAGKIATDAVRAREIAADAVNANHMQSNSVGADQIIANSVGADHVQARSIQAHNLQVGSFDNLFSDPMFYSFRDYGTSPRSPWAVASGNPASQWKWELHPSAGDSITNIGNSTSRMELYCGKVIAGDEMSLRIRVRTTSSTTGFRIIARHRGEDRGSPLHSTTLLGTSIDSLPSDSYWDFNWTVPNQPDISELWIDFQILSTATGDVRFSEPYIRKRVTSQLLVDGAVTARSIAAEAVKAEHITASSSLTAKVASFLTVQSNMIAANAVTADKISFGSLNGALITGLQIQTHTNNRGVKITSAGIRAFDSGGTETFTVNASDGSVSAVGGTFTGSTFQTGTNISGTGGVEIRSDPTHGNILGYDTSGNVTLRLGGRKNEFRGDVVAADITGSTITGSEVMTSSNWDSAGGAIIRQAGRHGHFVSVDDSGTITARLGGERNELSFLAITGDLTMGTRSSEGGLAPDRNRLRLKGRMPFDDGMSRDMIIYGLSPVFERGEADADWVVVYPEPRPHSNSAPIVTSTADPSSRFVVIMASTRNERTSGFDCWVAAVLDGSGGYNYRFRLRFTSFWRG